MSHDFPQFTSLPKELQMSILSQDRQTLHKALTVSKVYVEPVGKQLCLSASITRSMLDVYLTEQTPRIFGVEINKGNIETYVIFTLISKDKLHWSGETFGIVERKIPTEDPNKFREICKTHTIGKLTINDILNYLFDGHSDHTFDILTGYRIMSKIPVCANYILEMVYSWKQSYNESDLYYNCIFSQNKVNVLKWYSSLITLYTSVFNLGPEISNTLDTIQLNFTIVNEVSLYDNETNMTFDRVKKTVDELRHKIPKLFDILYLYA